MPTSTTFNLETHQRAERKALATIVEWRSSTGGVYALQTSKPDDWATNYTSYYTRSGSTGSYTYAAVTGESAPTWAASTYYTRVERELMGRRTEDSAIEYNADIETTTDILGINYTDINRTQPEQSFDPFVVIGGSKLGEYLNDKRRRNALSEISNFNVYIITLFIGDNTNGYAAEKHENCTITWDSIGGDTTTNFPITVHFSNEITIGTVDKFGTDFVFTPEATNVG